MNYVNIDTNNKTKIVATKQVVENLRTNEAIRNFLISSVSDIFKDKEILKKQKIVAIKNLVKDLKIALKNEAFNYSLNLVIRNLNEYHTLQKSEIKDENGKSKTISGVKADIIDSQESQAIIHALVLLAYSNSFAKICKNLYKGTK